MTLSEKQAKFTFNISLLIQFAFQKSFSLTFGEVYRTVEQQAIYFKSGRSKAMNSRHLQRLAVDFNIFKDGRMLFADKTLIEQDAEVCKVLGDYWKSLNTDNVWGGDFVSIADYYHFEMRP